MSNPSESVRPAPRDLSQQLHRLLIGTLGFFLPFLLYIAAGLRPSGDLPPWKLLSSVSAYYYTGATGIFIGVVFALALFLITYRGYEGVKADRVVGAIAGLAALGVALFPTAAPSPLVEPTWWRDWVRTTHYVSAVALFISFILFAGWLFRKSDVPKRSDRSAEKNRQDDLCLACAIVMTVCVVWAGSAIVTKGDIVIPEAIAIMAFAISWLSKGRVHEFVRRSPA